MGKKKKKEIKIEIEYQSLGLMQEAFEAAMKKANSETLMIYKGLSICPKKESASNSIHQAA